MGSIAPTRAGKPFFDEIIRHPAPAAFRAAHNSGAQSRWPGFHVTSWFDISKPESCRLFNDIQSRVRAASPTGHINAAGIQGLCCPREIDVAAIVIAAASRLTHRIADLAQLDSRRFRARGSATAQIAAMTKNPFAPKWL